MIDTEILKFALKTLARREMTVAHLAVKVAARFGECPQAVLDHLIARRFLDDRRFAENYLRRRPDYGAERLRSDLRERGVTESVLDAVIAEAKRPSLDDVLKARMSSLKLRSPLDPRSAARLFRHLRSLGYEEEAIREEIDRFI